MTPEHLAFIAAATGASAATRGERILGRQAEHVADREARHLRGPSRALGES
jgi:hypothetical protein